jgi:hypothetical protein
MYKFNEDKVLMEVKEWIDSPYRKHYSMNKIQSTEFINDARHGEGFCLGNIIKYAQRYGKKDGYRREDVLKIIHYAIILLNIESDKEKRLREFN